NCHGRKNGRPGLMMQGDSTAALNSSPPFTVKVSTDIAYAVGGIHYTSTRTQRPLTLDIYEPQCDEERITSRPAIVLAFGGAFHRGSKEDDAFTVGDGTNTSAAWYANYWAQQGYVAFCIDY